MLGKLNHLLNHLLCFKLLEKTSNKFLQSVLFFLLILQVQSNITLFNFLPYLLKTDIDDCAGRPCKNNGTCTDRVDGFNCSCAPGFNGPQCETGNRNRYYYMEESVLLGTKPLVDSIRHFIRDPSRVISGCHLCECRIVQWRHDSRLLLLLNWFLHIIKRTIHVGSEIWILCSRGKNNISRVSAT